METFGPNGEAWASQEFKDWRLRHTQEILEALDILQRAHFRWEDEAGKFGVLNASRNGVHGVETAQGIGRLHRTAYKSVVNLMRKLCR